MSTHKPGRILFWTWAAAAVVYWVTFFTVPKGGGDGTSGLVLIVTAPVCLVTFVLWVKLKWVQAKGRAWHSARARAAAE